MIKKWNKKLIQNINNKNNNNKKKENKKPPKNKKMKDYKKKKKKQKNKKKKYFNYNNHKMNEINKIISHYKLELLLYLLINNQSGFQVYLVNIVQNQSKTNKKNKK